MFEVKKRKMIMKYDTLILSKMQFPLSINIRNQTWPKLQLQKPIDTSEKKKKKDLAETE